MSERTYDLATTGSMVVDLICATPRFIGADEKILLPGDAGVRRLVGGVALNHAGWARIMGLRAAVFGKQGDDVDGRFLRAGMDRLGIARALDLSGSASSFSHVYVDREGRRAIYMSRGATGELTAEEVETRHRAVIESAGWVASEVSQVPLAAVRRALELARAAGAKTALDIDVPAEEALAGLGTARDLHSALGSADLLKASLSALEGLVPNDDVETAARELLDRFAPEVVVITLGADGAAVLAGGKLVRVPAPRAAVVDTTGAGDAFFGGVIAGRVRGLDWVTAVQLGNACGAACCERPGGFPDDPDACRARALALYRSASGLDFHVAVEPGSARGADSGLERFLEVAVAELGGVAERLDPAQLRAAGELIRGAQERGGRVHVTGVGKPGHVARYAAALLSSTGTPAAFLDATEATHGSVGQIRSGDVLVAISHSGTTRELLDCVAAARALGARAIAVTGDAGSELGRAAELAIEARIAHEGGPLGLAPRASVLAEVLVLAALSVELQSALGLTRQEYARVHPAGALGRAARD